MWNYTNPVKIQFGVGSFRTLPEAIRGRRFAVVTYSDPTFLRLTEAIADRAGDPLLVVDDVVANPDMVLLRAQSRRFAEVEESVELIVAIGGGSVLDSAKVLASAAGKFEEVQAGLEAGQPSGHANIPIVAVPTTAGTGSEVTCWATVWDTSAAQKYSLSDVSLYPETAIVDPALTVGKPRDLTLSTGLDALSHALESLWNINANPVSASLAVTAAREILDCLPVLVDDLSNLELRTAMARASLLSGLAFSNTRTAIAHNLSYPITLEYGVAHGIACSFALPVVLRSVAGLTGFRGASLRAIFGDDLHVGAGSLREWMAGLGVPTAVEGVGVPTGAWDGIVAAAFVGERGRNFVGDRAAFVAASQSLGLI